MFFLSVVPDLEMMVSLKFQNVYWYESQSVANP
jgi:hypothetical protein